MTSPRTYFRYPPTQIIERCDCITMDDLYSCGADACDPRLKDLPSAINIAAYNKHGAHLLKWPDDTLALIVSPCVLELSQLSPAKIIRAYHYVLDFDTRIYFDFC